MKDLTFTLTEQEANMVLNALAAQPYAQVYALIAKLQQQAVPKPPAEP